MFQHARKCVLHTYVKFFKRHQGFIGPPVFRDKAHDVLNAPMLFLLLHGILSLDHQSIPTTANGIALEYMIGEATFASLERLPLGLLPWQAVFY